MPDFEEDGMRIIVLILLGFINVYSEEKKPSHDQ